MTGLSGRNSSVRRGASAYRGETLAEARPCRVPLSPDPWPAPSHSYSHCPSSDSVLRSGCFTSLQVSPLFRFPLNFLAGFKSQSRTYWLSDLGQVPTHSHNWGHRGRGTQCASAVAGTVPRLGEVLREW